MFNDILLKPQCAIHLKFFGAPNAPKCYSPVKDNLTSCYILHACFAGMILLTENWHIKRSPQDIIIYTVDTGYNVPGI